MPANVVCVEVSRLLHLLIREYPLWPIQGLPLNKVFKFVMRETKEPFVARKPVRVWLADKYEQVTLARVSLWARVTTAPGLIPYKVISSSGNVLAIWHLSDF